MAYSELSHGIIHCEFDWLFKARFYALKYAKRTHMQVQQREAYLGFGKIFCNNWGY